ncbi:MAG: glutamine-hydrolyzing GMP synthase [Armatimonadota bacterium]|nr:glutamine-hydrolyzing GMP synthase [Armatimonadota bacterium]MDR7443913.1 glutamine-hydrolyzing GMP synthase [Armatimonadota bacterium]MDR7570429.1 glutamine-hydrolyzing GMP synthase [Armatimonadota bacterium]MDR7613228.1 glutamine-hydrolyzing GMP synthase [Armatimonadota bacterium]
MQAEEPPPELRPPTSEIVLVLDFGAQYTQLIARRIRELRVYSLILPYDVSLARIRALRPKGIVLSGGPRSVYEPGAPQADPALLSLGIPVLGICYGMQWMAHVLGGRTGPSPQREYGRTRLVIEEPGALFRGLERRLLCWMSHGDAVLDLPPGFVRLARTDQDVCAAMAHPARQLFGVQFHPEVSHTPWGREVLRNFLFGVCGCTGSWTMTSFLDQAIARVREQVGRGRVLCALSGGVDSSAAAALVHRAVGEQLSCVFVDHGFLRKGEADQVVRTFRDHFRIPLLHVDASARFLERLRGVVDPEEKRRRIGEEFVRVFEEHARRLGRIDFLVQGTLYPDVIESGTRTAARIKTHHNVGGLPERMSFQLVEPFRELFKDEVRELAKALGLPDELIWRHPFPGPGLAIRVVGEVTEEKLRILREADAIVTEEIRRAGLSRSLWQAFCVLLPVRAVGVAGDSRTYGYVAVVRAVTSEDGMTADWARLPPELLETLAARITREVPEITRVVYDITSKPPATIEWE